MSHPPPYVQYNPNGNGSGIPFCRIEPGVETDNFQLDSPVADDTSTVGLALNGFSQMVTKTLPASFAAFVSSASIPAIANSVAVYDGTSGTLIEQVPVTIDQSGNVANVATINGGLISGNNTGNVTLAAVDSSGAPNPNAATLSGATGQVLNLNSASATAPGVVNNSTQTFSGNKTFTNVVGIASGLVSLPGVYFTATNDDGIYFDLSANSFAIASAGGQRYMAYRTKTGLVNGGGSTAANNLFTLSGIASPSTVMAHINYMLMCVDDSGNVQCNTGTSWVSMYSLAGQINTTSTVTGSSNANTGTISATFDATTPVTGTSITVFINPDSSFSISVIAQLQVWFSVQFVNPPNVAVVYLT